LKNRLENEVINVVKSLRTWGNLPCKVAVVHGGPGAPGSVTPVAKELSMNIGVIEPFQTAHSVEGQIDELATVLDKYGQLPVTLIGWSWGAILSYMTTARYPTLVKKLILVSMPPLLLKTDPKIPEEWFNRLTEEERAEFNFLEKFIWDRVEEDKNPSLGQLFQLFTKGDSVDFMPDDDTIPVAQLDINIAVGLEMRKILTDGILLEIGRQIVCPVVAIHGADDLRCPAEEVREPLMRVLNDFRFILLEKCGHYPWYEKHARDNFFRTLSEEI
jgi:pimeloyl-ACP methyl ester carboxylesterase